MVWYVFFATTALVSTYLFWSVPFFGIAVACRYGIHGTVPVPVPIIIAVDSQLFNP
jgi:hypothetical protein